MNELTYFFLIYIHIGYAAAVLGHVKQPFRYQFTIFVFPPGLQRALQKVRTKTSKSHEI